MTAYKEVHLHTLSYVHVLFIRPHLSSSLFHSLIYKVEKIPVKIEAVRFIFYLLLLLIVGEKVALMALLLTRSTIQIIDPIL